MVERRNHASQVWEGRDEAPHKLERVVRDRTDTGALWRAVDGEVPAHGNGQHGSKRGSVSDEFKGERHAGARAPTARAFRTRLGLISNWGVLKLTC